MLFKNQKLKKNKQTKQKIKLKFLKFNNKNNNIKIYNSFFIND